MTLDEKLCATLKSVFTKYHESSTITNDEIIDAIINYINLYESDYHIEHHCVKCECSNSNDTTSLTFLLSVCKDIMSSKEIIDVIEWYLVNYQTDYRIVRS